MNSKELTAVGWLHSEYKRILGSVLVAPQQIIEMSDALENAKEIEMEKEYRTTHIYTEKDMKDMFEIGRAYQSNGEMEYHFSNAIKEFKQPEQ